MNCGIWVLYGLPKVHPDSLTVLTINGLGFVIEIVYLVLFYIYSAGNQKTRVRNIAIVEALFVVLLGIGLIFCDTTEVRSRIVGIIGVATNIFVYGSPLSVLVCISPLLILNYFFAYFKYMLFNSFSVNSSLDN